MDGALESLGSQFVPPEFYQTSSDSSLFGSQRGSDNEEPLNTSSRGLSTPVSPSATLRRKDTLSPKPNGPLGLDTESKGKGKRQESRSRSRNEDRSYWKTLRDFVDDKSIEDALDVIENDRLALDVCLRTILSPLIFQQYNRSS